jgi:hypothetical protein
VRTRSGGEGGVVLQVHVQVAQVQVVDAELLAHGLGQGRLVDDLLLQQEFPEPDLIALRLLHIRLLLQHAVNLHGRDVTLVHQDLAELLLGLHGKRHAHHPDRARGRYLSW